MRRNQSSEAHREGPRLERDWKRISIDIVTNKGKYFSTVYKKAKKGFERITTIP